MDTITTFVTGTYYSGIKRWAKIGITDKSATFCLLRWSEDCVNEKGVMYHTSERVTVRLNKHGFYFKNPFGMFRKDEETEIFIKP